MKLVSVLSIFLIPKPGSFTSVSDRRAILAAFLFGSRETELHLAASLGEVLAALRSGESVVLGQPAGQITAAGASDRRTLMDVRRAEPTSHLPDRKQGRGGAQPIWAMGINI